MPPKNNDSLELTEKTRARLDNNILNLNRGKIKDPLDEYKNKKGQNLSLSLFSLDEDKKDKKDAPKKSGAGKMTLEQIRKEYNDAMDKYISNKGPIDRNLYDYIAKLEDKMLNYKDEPEPIKKEKKKVAKEILEEVKEIKTKPLKANNEKKIKEVKKEIKDNIKKLEKEKPKEKKIRKKYIVELDHYQKDINMEMKKNAQKENK